MNKEHNPGDNQKEATVPKRQIYKTQGKCPESKAVVQILASKNR